MNIKEFKKYRIEGRKKLLSKILEVFKKLNPVAIHQFGSGATDYKDEFSDIDILITFKDSEIENVLPKLNRIFKNIAPVLVKHHSKSFSPTRGSATQIIHETSFGLFQVDYYISKDLKVVIKPNKNIKEPHTLKKDINLLLCLIFISVKGIIRKWDSPDFVNNLKIVHQKFRKRHRNKIRRRKITLSFKFNYKLLFDLYPIANQKQKKAILKIKDYLTQVEKIYP